MKARSWMVAATGALMLAASLGAAAARTEGMAPDFTLRETTGSPVRLSSLRGKVVFLDFWASWCPPCRMSIPKVQQLSDKFKNSGVIVLGINVENDAKAAAKYAQKEHLSYSILVGDDKVERDYRISGIPGFFIIDPNGKILQKYEGYFPGLENEWDKVITQALNNTQKPLNKKARTK